MSILSLFHICSPLLRTNCLEKKEIYENFICSVCLDLCDTPVVTLCNHICCYKCMYYSLLHKRNCPICKQTVKNNDLRKITDKLLFKATSNQPVDISSSQQNGDTPSNNISRNGENSIRMNDKMGRSEIGRDKVRRGKNGPGKIGPGKIGRGKIGRGKIGRGKIRQSKSDNNISNPVSTINRHWLSTATSRTSVPLSRCAVNSSIHSVRGNHMSYASVGSSCSSDETGKTHRLSTQLAYCYQNRKTCSCISRGGSSRSGNSRSGNSRSGNSRSGNSRSGSIRSGSIRSGSSRSGSIRSGSSRSGESDHCAGSGEEENSSADEFLNILPLRKNFNFKEKNSKDIIVIMEELFQFDNIDMSNIYVDNREFFLCNKNCFTNTIKRLRQELERALILLYFCCCVGMPAMFSLGYISFIMTKGIFKFSFLVTNAFLSLSHRLFLRMFQS
ncbi:zinc finger protein, putative [Plasmodium ovale wallikeri]|uniref:Zinc finger protein, putative n=1 Tax=Plasmodium ovale wallikeri TaxID=864142 RepID=A0A1A8YR88_PLAOA|nr:zinc finger protein, putative [Plasmodium ovale wallikeri]